MQSPLSPERGTTAAPRRNPAALPAARMLLPAPLARQSVTARRGRRTLACLSLAGIAVGIALIGAVCLLGPAAAVPSFSSACPWPLFYLHARDSGARTMFWLKAWNALAFLAVALALDRLLRSDPARRTRARLLWTANPLMLLAAMAGGHNDVLGAIFAVLALASFRRAYFIDGMLAGVLAGTAVVLNVPFALPGAGLAIAAIRAPRALAGLAIGVAAVVLPTYAVAGKPAIAAVMPEAGRAFSPYQPWQLLARLAPSFGTLSRTEELAALAVSVALAAVLLWRMPAGPAEFPAVRPALALTLAWLICSPQQQTWYDIMIFPLLALLPATRLDWIAIARAAVTAIGQLPAVITRTAEPPCVAPAGRPCTR